MKSSPSIRTKNKSVVSIQIRRPNTFADRLKNDLSSITQLKAISNKQYLKACYSNKGTNEHEFIYGDGLQKGHSKKKSQSQF
jgi:hypothetical protein